ncbi:apoptosis-linked protein [Coprinopsis marcescibilis]|uniref:Apoptosis-linked protein n=1 Tax=Coprinopsis marcescibilis TaxID=230819 RepID=A0A5C3LAK4_COPMA|nr:apoptosis-linked protein [Coprinopsis marcescibilis]
MSINYGQFGGPQRHSSVASQYGRHPAPPPPPTSGYGHQAPNYYPPPVPPGADPNLWSYFSAVDADRSGAISVTELQQALVNGNWSRFDLDTVKMLMGIFDTDRSGTINFTEFAGLWKYIQDWQNVFRHFDRDRSGTIEGHELAEALRSFGYNLSPNLLSQIEHKYASAPVGTFGPPPGITFDRFVRACVAVKTLTEAFQRVDTDRDGWVQMNYEQFMGIVLSAP